MSPPVANAPTAIPGCSAYRLRAALNRSVYARKILSPKRFGAALSLQPTEVPGALQALEDDGLLRTIPYVAEIDAGPWFLLTPKGQSLL